MDLGYEYDYYCGGRFIRCIDCDRLVRINIKDNSTTRCKECQQKENKDNQNKRYKKWYDKHKT